MDIGENSAEGYFMEGYSTGDLVRSLCGHDADGIFIVLSAEDGYVTVCDGKRRKAANKKRKKYRHVQSLKLHSDLISGAAPYEVDAVCRREIKRLKNLI